MGQVAITITLPPDPTNFHHFNRQMNHGFCTGSQLHRYRSLPDTQCIAVRLLALQWSNSINRGSFNWRFADAKSAPTYLKHFMVQATGRAC